MTAKQKKRNEKRKRVREEKSQLRHSLRPTRASLQPSRTGNSEVSFPSISMTVTLKDLGVDINGSLNGSSGHGGETALALRAAWTDLARSMFVRCQSAQSTKRCWPPTSTCKCNSEVLAAQRDRERTSSPVPIIRLLCCEIQGCQDEPL